MALVITSVQKYVCLIDCFFISINSKTTEKMKKHMFCTPFLDNTEPIFAKMADDFKWKKKRV